MEDGSLLENLDEALDNAPRFGLNAKALILKALEEARAAEGNEDAAKAPGARELAGQQAAQSGSKYLEAVEPKERLQLPYNPRAKFARVIRQTVLNRLAGQHLALAAFHAGELPPTAVAKDCELRRQAFATALAQEADLYGRCSTGQVYQNLAARTQALHWTQPQYPVVREEEEQAAPAGQQGGPGREEQPSAASTAPGEGEGGTTAAGNGDTSGSGGKGGSGKGGGSGWQKEGQPPAKRARTAAGRGPAPVLMEVDLDWDQAAPAEEEEEGNAVQKAQRGSAGEGGTAAPAGAVAAGRAGCQVEGGSLEEQGQQQEGQQEQQGRGHGVGVDERGAGQPKKPAPPPTRIAAPAAPDLLATVAPPAGGGGLEAGYLPSEAAAAAAAAATMAAAMAAAPLEGCLQGGEAACDGSKGSKGRGSTAQGAAEACADEPAEGVVPLEQWPQPQHPHEQQQQPPQQQPGQGTVAPTGLAATASGAAAAADTADGSRGGPTAAGSVAAAGVAADGGGTASGVRDAVLLFIRAELDPLLRRGRLAPAVYEAVLGKCCSKVLARHAGASSADFLALEGTSVRKLVAQYLEFYSSSSS